MFDSLTLEELAELHLHLWRASVNAAKLARYVDWSFGMAAESAWRELREQGAEANLLAREVTDVICAQSIGKAA